MGNISYGQPWKTQVVVIPVGQSSTIQLPLFSNAVTDPWTVDVYDMNKVFFGGETLLGLALDHKTGNNGDVLNLTITPYAFDSQLKAAIFVVESRFGNNVSLSLGTVIPP
jgi:hypothetical protein